MNQKVLLRELHKQAFIRPQVATLTPRSGPSLQTDRDSVGWIEYEACEEHEHDMDSYSKPKVLFATFLMHTRVLETCAGFAHSHQ